LATRPVTSRAALVTPTAAPWATFSNVAPKTLTDWATSLRRISRSTRVRCFLSSRSTRLRAVVPRRSNVFRRRSAFVRRCLSSRCSFELSL
jgi:hypothetical protein